MKTIIKTGKRKYGRGTYERKVWVDMKIESTEYDYEMRDRHDNILLKVTADEVEYQTYFNTDLFVEAHKLGQTIRVAVAHCRATGKNYLSMER